MTKPIHALCAAALLGLTATACAPTVATRGNMTDPELVSAIRAGESRREDVASLLGTPTSVGTFDPDVWYYIGQRTEKTAFFQPDVVERRVVVVQFDPSGVVSGVQQMDAEAGQDVSIVSRATPTHGREMTFLEQMIGNVGRFSAKDKGRGPGGL
ncbi:outer membrane protein assembly factor BamE [Azospirillum halopraeferens]|uniref:outer membrane protein assembly factor BamE n=1 Tax=Azospirillum halopraeferens TaxID=34010 RepID=UPI000408FB16|nr:outer membrane protein assembly factor BamE [Azospirillum halopraeferens]